MNKEVNVKLERYNVEIQYIFSMSPFRLTRTTRFSTNATLILLMPEDIYDPKDSTQRQSLKQYHTLRC